VLVYYGDLPVQETGAELPRKGLKLKAKLDVRTADGQEGTVKQWVPGETAWLMTEGMEVPLRVDASGAPLEIDFEALAGELEGRSGEAEAAHKEQSSLTYDIPKKEEFKDAAEGVKDAAKGLRAAWRKRRD
jgi:hypothetical protein